MISSATPAQSGYQYRCVVRDSKPGCGDEVISHPATLTVTPRPTPQTGDPFAPALLLGLALTSLTGLWAILRRKRV